MNLWAGILKFLPKFLPTREEDWREAKSCRHCKEAAMISQDQGLFPRPFYDVGGIPVSRI